jgi:predicted dehydrogenase
MSRRLRIGIVGFGHVHVNFVSSLYQAHPRAQLVACADTRPLRPELRAAPYTREWNREYVMRQCGLDKLYDDWREMLAKESLDAAIVTCENARHGEVAEACARAGVHVCVEKPLAASWEEAQRMTRASREAGTLLLVNWPSAWLPHARKAKELIDAGMIGRVLEVGYRVGDTGVLGRGARHKLAETAGEMTGEERGATWWHQVETGGGAFLDLCCYGAMYSRWFTGESAISALGLKANLDSEWADAEDFGSLLIRFPHAVGSGQGSWATFGSEYLKTSPVAAYGSAGLLSFPIYGGQPVVVLERPGAAPETIEPDPLPAGRANIAEEFLHCIETGDAPFPILAPEFNLEVMDILEAGARSAASGRMEPVDRASWSAA